MRTRTSARNQMIMWRELGGAAPSAPTKTPLQIAEAILADYEKRPGMPARRLAHARRCVMNERRKAAIAAAKAHAKGKQP